MDFSEAGRPLDVPNLEKRIMILERAVALLIRRFDWYPHSGLQLNDYNNEAARMIMGYDNWDPKKLDKGG